MAYSYGRDGLTLPVLVWRLFLGDVCGTPERAWVDASGIDLQHRSVELARGRCRRIQAVEVAKVLPRLSDGAWIIVVVRHLVPGDHCLRFQGLELIERGDPLKPAPCVGLAEIRMNAVVDGIPANDQFDRRDVQTR